VEPVAGVVADFGITAVSAEMGQWILKKAGHGASPQFGFGDL